MINKCPFLNVIPKNFLSKCGDSLGHYSRSCPTMSSFLSNSTNHQITRSLKTTTHFHESATLECDVVTDKKKCPLKKLINGFSATFDSIYGSNLGSLNSDKPSTTHFSFEKSHESTVNEEFYDAIDKEESFNYEEFFDEKIEEKVKDNSYRVFRRISRSANEFPIGKSLQTGIHIENAFNPNDVTIWCSNDYLGMSRHPAIISTARETIESYGVGSGGTRNISGNSPLHEKLEHTLAKWYKKDSGLLFTSCYVANDTVLYTLAKMLPNCVILSDKGNHASMIQGIRNSGVEKIVYEHNNFVDLENKLSKLEKSRPKIIAFESVNSMNGSVANIDKICKLARKYGAITFLDEVHAVGLYGYNGSGVAELQNCLHQVDIISGTLGKAVGTIGGFIVGNSKLVDAMRSYGAGFIFTTSLPPVILASSIESINILNSMEGRALRKQQKENVSYLRQEMANLGLPITPSQSHIVTIHVGNAKNCQMISEHLLNKHKMYIQAINYPTVPRGSERLRIAPTPYHTKEMSKELVHNLVDSWKSCGLDLLSTCCEQNSNCSNKRRGCPLLNKWRDMVMNNELTAA